MRVKDITKVLLLCKTLTLTLSQWERELSADDYKDFAKDFYDYATESRSIFMAFSANGGRIPYERMERLPTLQAKITDLSFRIWKKSVGEGGAQTSLSTGVIPDFLGQKRDSNPQTFELNGDVGYEDSPVDDMPPPP